MKKNIIIILAVFIVPALAYWGLTLSNSSTAKDVDSVGKPRVIKFSSAMCIDCQKMAKVMAEIKPKYADRIIFTDVNVQDTNSFTQSQVKKYKITLVPTIILLDSSGKQVRKIEDAIPAAEMESYLEGLK